ncbi:MAG: phosphatidate cytidylyltransferase [Acidobacteria bacterium]|nr:phosphatidate cytidylyltransferase [Acidobacteriota bacterium]
MSDRFWDEPDDDPKDKTEGVRIIGAEEAAEAIERGDVAQRRAEGELRYGDRPAPPPEDAQAAVRFPLPADQADALVRPRPVTPPLPHWTDPPTGEVPRVLGDSAESDDDLDAWSGFAGSAPRWRDQVGDWQEADFDPAALTHDDESRVGALDERRPDDLFLFADAEPVALPEVPKRRRATPAAPPRARRPVPSRLADGQRDLQMATATGLGLIVITLVLFKIGPAAAMVLVTAVLLAAAAELFGSLQQSGYQPATLLGLVATGGLALGSYWKGETAMPLVLALAVIVTLLWYLTGVTRQNPTMNAGVTLLGIGQIGVLGSFAALILTLPDGIGILLGVIVAVVANDIGALVVGQQMGRAPVAPNVSPNKTLEGLVGGGVFSIVLSVLLLSMLLSLTPWDTGSAFALGVVVAIAAPLGDLCESMVKRDLGIKDMGSFLPGHGGVLDRFDALLFCLPATYYLCRLLNIA